MQAELADTRPAGRQVARPPQRQCDAGVVKTIGNILWFCLAGLWLSIGYAFAAVIMTLLIVTAPFGIAAWRLATYVIWPFGRSVVSRPGAGAASTIGNILWFVLAGLWIAIGHVISGVLWCCTIIGIPFGIVSLDWRASPWLLSARTSSSEDRSRLGSLSL